MSRALRFILKLIGFCTVIVSSVCLTVAYWEELKKASSRLHLLRRTKYCPSYEDEGEESDFFFYE